MKVEPYLEMNFLPTDEEPTFDLSFNTDNISFKILELSENDIKEIIQELQDMLELMMGAFLNSKQT